MALTFIRALTLLSALCSIQASAGEEEVISQEFAITLDHSNFTQTVAKQDFIFVNFYAPGCGFCKSLAPEYEKAASILEKHDPPITLAKYDAFEPANKDDVRNIKIRGFPTLKIIRNGGKIVEDEYEGPRKAEAIVEYVIKQFGPASVEIKSAHHAATLIHPNNTFIVGVFPEFKGEEYENFTKLAEKLRNDYDFGHTLDAKFLPRGDFLVKGPFIRLLKPFDELFLDFQNFDLGAMEKFIEEEGAPSVIIYDTQPGNPYITKFFSNEDKKTKVTMILNFTNENAAILMSKFNDIAYLLKGGKTSFLLGDLEPSQRILKFYKLDKSLVPLIYIQKNGAQKYVKANVGPDEVVPWFKKFLDGKIEEYIRSQPIPLEDNEPVKMVVHRNFHDMVYNSRKEVLLEFYAPWCGHCKKLAPILNEVALSYLKDPNVLIAKFDATANDIPSSIFKVNSYPTMYYISSKKEMKEIIKYTGERTKKNIINFIEKHKFDKKIKNQSDNGSMSTSEIDSFRDEL
ncbi:protein disulfide-isomerase-like [Amaranthus tricolor]|uniref:protein disulfide-isomerase-like n=1 Tax=Amaranthus tricolor TaxID=29722 RepID=UPI002589AC28|nr:protein disulfide-isomerase-like [Amaranthus tricolor]